MVAGIRERREREKALPSPPPKCEGCQQAGQNIGKLCFSCAILPKTDGWSWKKCAQCGKEWSKLYVNGLCYDCVREKDAKRDARKRAEERFKRIFGTVKAMNYYTFERFQVLPGNSVAYKACKQFNSEQDNLYVFGPCGTGKTHLAYATAKMYALNDKNVVISTTLKIVDTFRTLKDSEKEDRFLNFSECDLLLIDDLGISKYTDFALEVFCEILNRRTLRMRNGLIVTSNLNLDRLASKNDDRLASRLAGICRVVEVSGQDHRLGTGA